LPCSEPLQFFFKIKLLRYDSANRLFCNDDFDIISALKGWQRNDDFILALSGMIINRDLLKIKLK
jgi:hypothetical protein